MARVQLVSRCWVWPGCVTNMKDMTCASSSRARPDPDKWPPAQPSPAQPRQQYYRLAGDCADCTLAPPQQAACLCCWWPSLCLTADRSVTRHQVAARPRLQPPVTSSSQGEAVTRSPRPQCGGWPWQCARQDEHKCGCWLGPRPPELTARHKPWSWQQQHLEPRPSPVLAR